MDVPLALPLPPPPDEDILMATQVLQLRQMMLPRQFSLTMETWVARHEDLRTAARCAVTFSVLVAGLNSYMRSQRRAATRQ
ncbi:hypothetical protein [Herbaspirillum sp. AP21]|uniref:hypothetical protein n=1 Tax=unclassified Herbaspirillum TaxID=2624150 RepID=UPI00351A8A42